MAMVAALAEAPAALEEFTSLVGKGSKVQGLGNTLLEHLNNFKGSVSKNDYSGALKHIKNAHSTFNNMMDHSDVKGVANNLRTHIETAQAVVAQLDPSQQPTVEGSVGEGSVAASGGSKKKSRKRKSRKIKKKSKRKTKRNKRKTKRKSRK